MISSRWLALALAVVPAWGCSSPFDLSERIALDVARERWDNRPFQDYVFDTRHDCFCVAPEQTGPVRIVVRQDAIVSVTLIETGGSIPAAGWYTIEQLFELIPGFAGSGGVEDVDVEYDDTLWYPGSVEVRYEEGILDAGSRYTVSAVGPAP
jgi:hypothetical protein